MAKVVSHRTKVTIRAVTHMLDGTTRTTTHKLLLNVYAEKDGTRYVNYGYQKRPLVQADPPIAEVHSHQVRLSPFSSEAGRN